MLKLGFIALTLAAPTVARAETISCTARVALNRVYDATLDTVSGEMFVKNDAGTEMRGRATSYYSATTGNTSYFLATGFAAGIELEFESDADHRIALCLKDTE